MFVGWSHMYKSVRKPDHSAYEVVNMAHVYAEFFNNCEKIYYISIGPLNLQSTFVKSALSFESLTLVFAVKVKKV
jgi:hypothetical protein